MNVSDRALSVQTTVRSDDDGLIDFQLILIWGLANKLGLCTKLPHRRTINS